MIKKKLKRAKQKTLLRKRERLFLDVLEEVLPSNRRVSTQLRLWDVVKCIDMGNKKRYGENKIRAKHIDFVIFDKESSEITQCIELDGSSHSSSYSSKSDSFKNALFREVGIPFLRIKSTDDFDKEKLKDLIL